MKSDTFPTLQAKHHRRVIIHHFSPPVPPTPQVCTWPCTSAPCCLAVSAWSMPASPEWDSKSWAWQAGNDRMDLTVGFLHHLLTNPRFFLHHLTISDITSNHIFVTTSKVWKPKPTKNQRNFPPTCAAGGIGSGKIGPSTLAYVSTRTHPRGITPSMDMFLRKQF